MKKLNLCAAGIAALFCTYCSDSNSVKDVAGTSEEMNELAENDSSSSTKDTKQSSSSVNDEGKSSSSTETGNDQSSSSTEPTLSSSSHESQTPPQASSLDYYLWQYGLENKVKFDKAVLAFSASEMVSRTPGIDGGAGATEFDGQGVSKFVQGNIGAVQAFFPNAAEKYADLIEATKNGTNECSLYSFNLYGSEEYAGHVLEYISTDTVKVVDIEAKNCEASTEYQIVRFLFSYCGDVNRDPVIERSTVQSNIEKDNCPASKTDDEWVNVIDSEQADTTDFPAEKCAPGSDCDGDGIPDGIYRPDLEPCDTDTLLYFYERHYQCVEGKWQYLPPPGPDSTYSQARNVSVLPRQGMAVTPRVVMARNDDGTISIRDDGYYASNNFVIEAVYTELSGDTIVVDVIYPDGANVSSYQISALTFTVSKVYTNVKYIKYKDDDRVKEIQEVDELLPCASSSTCQECGEGLDC